MVSSCCKGVNRSKNGVLRVFVWEVIMVKELSDGVVRVSHYE